MEIRYHGANCVRLSDKKVVLTVDDNLKQLGVKTVTKPQDIALYTFNATTNKDNPGRFLIDGPGEYEISGVSIKGMPAQAHIDKEGQNATIYLIKIDNFNIVVLGHIATALDDEQIETLGIVDVLIIPVGNSGYTLDAAEAVSVIKKIEPKIVIPTHFADKAIKYEVPQIDLQQFLEAIGVSEPESSEAFTLKEKELGDKTRVIVLKRSEK